MTDTEKLAEEAMRDAKKTFFGLKESVELILVKHQAENVDPLNIYNITYKLTLIDFVEGYASFLVKVLPKDLLDKYYKEIEKHPSISEMKKNWREI